MNLLPTELLFYLLQYIDDSQLFSLSQINKFYYALCSDQLFWRYKLTTIGFSLHQIDDTLSAQQFYFLYRLKSIKQIPVFSFGDLLTTIWISKFNTLSDIISKLKSCQIVIDRFKFLQEHYPHKSFAPVIKFDLHRNRHHGSFSQAYQDFIIYIDSVSDINLITHQAERTIENWWKQESSAIVLSFEVYRI